MTKKCPYCGQSKSKRKYCQECGELLPDKRRSTEISTRFHGHCHYVMKELYRAGIMMTYEEVYLRALLTACSIPDDMLEPGARPYPHLILDGVLHPKRTSNRTNREMITACKGIELFAAEHDIGTLPEKTEDEGNENKD